MLTIGTWRRHLVALGVFVCFYVIFGTYLALNQERIVYRPFAQDFDNCPALGKAERITHNGTRMYYQGGSDRLFILYHGNAGSACDRVLLATFAAQNGYSYLIPEYAGYSNDTVSPSHDALKKNVRDVIDFLNTEELTTAVIFAESIGTGIAAYHVSLKPPDALLFISPFTTLRDIARSQFWFYPSRLVINAFDSVELLKGFEGRVLVVHGNEDEVIPMHLGKELYGSLTAAEKQFVLIEGGTHNTMYNYTEVYDAMREFLMNK